LKANCIQLSAPKKKQYLTLEEKVTEYNKLLNESSDELKKENNFSLSDKQKSRINRALDDPDVAKVLDGVHVLWECRVQKRY
jgi:hypothetical protein